MASSLGSDSGGRQSFTELAIEYIKTHVAPRRALLDQKQLLGCSKPKAPSLVSLVLHKIIRELRSDQEGLLCNIQSCLKTLPQDVLIRLLEDPQLPYLMLRKLLSAHRESSKDAAATLVDLDEMIIKHQRYLRSCLSPDNYFLLTLDDLAYCSSATPMHAASDNEFITFTRQDPPKGGLEFLDSRRQPHLHVLCCPKTVGTTFNRITSACLQGMDWSNVLVVGPLILKSLFREAPQDGEAEVDNDEEAEFACDDEQKIVIQLWGLNTSECLKKVEEIYDVWKANISNHSIFTRCVKTAEEFFFFSDNEYPSITIKLKLFRTRLHALLHLHPDVSAIGFDGDQVYMTPGCARTLETGYYTLSSSTLYNDSWSTFGPWYKYAQMGFGIRILPSYAKSLSDKIEVSRWSAGGRHEVAFVRPALKECGLKILKRIEYLGQTSRESDQRYNSPFGCFQNFIYGSHLGNDNLERDLSPLGRGNQLNMQLWGAVRRFICARVNIPYQEGGCKESMLDTSKSIVLAHILAGRDYVTRRIRWKHIADDLASVLEKQLVVPVFLPHDLEQQINQMVDDVRRDSQANFPDFLIPIHEPGKGRGFLPDYVETTDPVLGNVRYWVRSNEMLWGGIDPRIDEIFQLLDIIMWTFMSFEDNSGQPEYRADSEEFKRALSERLCARLPPDLEDCYPTPGVDNINLVFGTGADEPLYPHTAITAKEALNFGTWVFGAASLPDHYDHQLIPDELYWKEEYGDGMDIA